MNISLAQQYQYINWRRRTQLLYKRMLLESKSAAINQVIAYIIAGNDPRENPEYKDKYHALINEEEFRLMLGEIDSDLARSLLIREEDLHDDNSKE